MEKVIFVILHYQTLDITIQCIESILSVITYSNYEIVVIDNASTNGTGKKLEAIYQDNSIVSILLNDENLGFSAGNNIGFRYAKERKAEYIIILNNDTRIVQSNFVDVVKKIYKETHYYVLGPDIINLNGIHQSPIRGHVISKMELKKWYFKRKLFSIVLHLIRKIKLSKNNKFVLWFEKKYYTEDEKKVKKYNYLEKQENVEIQGSCIIFSPLYLKESNVAFAELSFMYGEEPILAYMCNMKKWKVIYSPEIKIEHMEKASVSNENENWIDKEIFYTDNLLIGLRALKEIM